MERHTLEDMVKIKKVEKPLKDNLVVLAPKEKKSYNMLWLIALISVVALFFAVSFLFSNAKVTVNPKTKDFVLNKTLTATKDTSADNLSYDLVVLSGEEKKEVVAGEEKDYLEYAKGSVLIYNSFSSSPQSFAINTRLEGSNGKIYKTQTSVTVPGMGKNGLPGKIGVDIYGEKVGEAYNSPPLDFTILGFKGTPKYSKFKAMSVGEITGGLSGKSRQVSDADKASTIKELTDTLLANLFAKAKNQTPKEFVLLQSATYLNIDENTITPSETPGNFIIDVKGTFSGILFNREKLTGEVIKAFSAGNPDTDVSNTYVSNIDALIFSDSLLNATNISDAGDITFNLTGAQKIVWQVDTEKLTGDLLGRNKNEFNQILAQYPNIDSADLQVKPVWQSTLPSKSEKIKIIVNYPN
jgi:hypothetical protein